jgi:ribosomal protein L7Ae-like RNA K-turn-binding protein
MNRTMTLREKFDILIYKGVDKGIQRLFSKYAFQDNKGQIVFDFFDHQGHRCDTEILSLHRNKQASFGISALNLSDNIRSVFASDSYASLIYFANQFKGRISFEKAGFLVIGADFDQSLVKQALDKMPTKVKVITVFSSSILGRVMDCKVQDLIHDRACSYRLGNDLVQFENSKKVSTESIQSFSLRTYCISQGVKQTVRTFKPKKKGVESFYELNHQTWDVFK